MIKKEKEITSKIPLIEGILGFFRDKKDQSTKEFDRVQFLQDENLQADFFNEKFISIEKILLRVFLCKEIEKKLIKEKVIKKDHSFFKQILRVIELNPHHYKKIYEFCTFMYLEDPKGVHEHWDFREKIPKNEFDESIANSLYRSPQCFKIFVKNMKKEDLESIRIYSEKHVSLPPMDIKTKVMKNILISHGAHLTGQKKLLEMINEKLDIPDNYDLLVSHIDKSALNQYYLAKLNWVDFNNTITDYSFLGVNERTTIENIAKYNFMDKSLPEAIYDKTVYVGGGKSFEPEDLELLMRYFYADPFLKTKMVSYLRDKVSRATPKYKNKWQYFVTLFDAEQLDATLPNKQDNAKKRTKI